MPTLHKVTHISRTPKRGLTDEEVREILRLYAEGKGSQHTLARQFGTSQSKVFNLIKGAKKS
jgi:hypothetical protein